MRLGYPSRARTQLLRWSIMSATVSVRQAARSDAMSVLARWGLAARAAIYLLIGVLAIALATGSRQGETDQRGAMQELTRHTGGTALVWIIGIGLAGYALWRLSERSEEHTSE